MFGFFKNKQSSFDRLSAKDKALVYITNEIPTSEENKHWRCPACNVELVIRFQSGISKDEEWLATSVSCPKCNFESASDGVGKIPQWWIDEDNK